MKQMKIYECEFVFTKQGDVCKGSFRIVVDIQVYYPLSYEQIKERAYYEAAKIEFPDEYKDYNKIQSFCVKREYEL